MFRKLSKYLVILIILWSGLWFAGSIVTDQAVQYVENETANQSESITCANRKIGGYPFSMSVDCGLVTLESGGIKAVIENLKGTALLYNPGHIAAQALGPMRISLPEAYDLGAQFLTTWKHADFNASAAASGVKHIYLEGTEVSSIFDGSASFLKQVKMKDARLELRPDSKNATNFGIQFVGNGLEILGRSNMLPEMNLALDAKAVSAGSQIDFETELFLQDWINNGGILNLASALFESLEFKVVASGPLQVSKDGLLSGNLTLHLSNYDKLPELAAQLDPRLVEPARQAVVFIGGFPNNGPEGEKELVFRLNKGKIYAGLFPLPVKIPPLF